MWVAGDEDDKLYASSLVIGARDATKDTVAQSHNGQVVAVVTHPKPVRRLVGGRPSRQARRDK